MIGKERAASEYPSAFIKTLRRNKEKWESPYDVSPERRPDVEVMAWDKS